MGSIYLMMEIFISFLKKFGSKKVMDDIMISLPYEDILPENKEILVEISKIMEIKTKNRWVILGKITRELINCEIQKV